MDWVEGSWLLIRRDTWEKVGGFDETIFMYGEDVDLCRCVENLGLFNAQIPKVFYKHYTGWSVIVFRCSTRPSGASFRSTSTRCSGSVRRRFSISALIFGSSRTSSCGGPSARSSITTRWLLYTRCSNSGGPRSESVRRRSRKASASERTHDVAVDSKRTLRNMSPGVVAQNPLLQ